MPERLPLVSNTDLTNEIFEMAPSGTMAWVGEQTHALQDCQHLFLAYWRTAPTCQLSFKRMRFQRMHACLLHFARSLRPGMGMSSAPCDRPITPRSAPPEWGMASRGRHSDEPAVSLSSVISGLPYSLLVLRWLETKPSGHCIRRYVCPFALRSTSQWPLGNCACCCC